MCARGPVQSRCATGATVPHCPMCSGRRPTRTLANLLAADAGRSIADEKKAMVQASGVKSLASKSHGTIGDGAVGGLGTTAGFRPATQGGAGRRWQDRTPLAGHWLSWLHRCNERQQPCMMLISTNGYPGKPVARIFFQLSDAVAQKTLSSKDSC
jgi:hypothetical protein